MPEEPDQRPARPATARSASRRGKGNGGLPSAYDQSRFEYRLEWGLKGVRHASARGDIVVIVDVIRFSTAILAAVEAGAAIVAFPPADGSAAGDPARTQGRRRASALKGPRAAAPFSGAAPEVARRIARWSAEVVAYAAHGGSAARLLVGCVRNATAVGRAAERHRQALGAPVTVVPCGERWDRDEAEQGDPVFWPCIEDYLAAGAILNAVQGSCSPEADVCLGAFRVARPRVAELIWECESGRRLRAGGFADDVRYSAALDASRVVPELVEGHFRLPGDALLPSGERRG